MSEQETKPMAESVEEKEATPSKEPGNGSQASAPALVMSEKIDDTPEKQETLPVSVERAIPPARPEMFTLSDEEVERQMHHLSRRSFLWGAVAVAGSFAGLKWLNSQYTDNGIPWPFRRVLEVNEGFARDYFQDGRLAPTFDRRMAGTPKPNGDIGLPDDFDPSTWKLHLVGLADTTASSSADAAPTTGSTDKKSGKKQPATNQQDGSANDSSNTSSDDNSSGDNANNSGDDSGSSEATSPTMLTLADIKNLPKYDMVTELKCIEGWSVIVHWTGARLADLIALHPPMTKSGNPPDVKHHPEDLVNYVSLETPDGGYYVGLDMASALHPQTLLCYEMNGQPLPLEHGAPLRLAIPVKYGIKNIKRIGTIRFTNQRPKDYWAEQGYDWYAGH